MSENNVPTVYEWGGGAAAFDRLTTVFYRRVREDPILSPLFAHMPADHPKHVAAWLAEVFGGPKTYTTELGGYPHMLSKHFNLGLTEEQRARWAQLIAASADEAGLPADPEFRSAFVAYIEWGTRIALANSQPGATPPPVAPVPRWGWGEAPPPPRAREPEPPIDTPTRGDTTMPSFSQDIGPLFRDKDVQSMAWAFDLHKYEDVKAQANAIYDRLARGTMPCDGAWPREQVALFRQWMDQGYTP